MPDPIAAHETELLTIVEAADLLRAAVATLPLLAAPQHRPPQLPGRPPRPLPPRRPPNLDRRESRPGQ
jgi:hypothetical protein